MVLVLVVLVVLVEILPLLYDNYHEELLYRFFVVLLLLFELLVNFQDVVKCLIAKLKRLSAIDHIANATINLVSAFGVCL